MSLRVVKAQTVRVDLFANAVATSMRRLPASILASHAPIARPFRIARRITAIDPVINSRRLSRRPIFETRSSLAKDLAPTGRFLSRQQPTPSGAFQTVCKGFHLR